MLSVKRPVDSKFPINSSFGIDRELVINHHENEHVHHGIDFKVPVGTPVTAMVDGKIFKVGYEDPSNENKGLGLRVWQLFTQDNQLYYAWYGHLSEIKVEEGDTVKVGDPIGISGCTGGATGPHLHVQFRAVNTGEMLNAEFV